MFFDKKFSKSSEFYFLESTLERSIRDIVEAKNTLIRERHNHSGSSITVYVSQRIQKTEIYPANEKSALAFLITDLGLNSGSNFDIECGVTLRRKGHQKP